MKMTILSMLFLFSAVNILNAGNSSDQSNNRDKEKILFVLTSHKQLGDTGRETGVYLSEAAHPWKVLKGEYQIDFVSPAGGKVPVDGFDLEDPVNKEFWENEQIQKQLANTMKPSEVNPEDYVAIHYVGGHGTMWDFPQNETLAGIASSIYENEGVVSAVCHGPAGLVNIQLTDGAYLIEGKKVAGFSNAEEKAAGLLQVVPFLLEDKLKERGAVYSEGTKFTEHAVRDGRLVTGQNPQSATKMAEMVLEVLQREK